MENDELLKDAVPAGDDMGLKNYEAYRDAVWEEEAEALEIEEDETEYAEECAILDALESRGGLDYAELQKSCGIEDSYRYEDALCRLEEKGYIRFDRDPGDGRRIIRYVPSLT
ncbi:MAG: hypothetical protein LUC24_03425 [Bacteroidales bacterium]|nr:hypothetical protein [Bacteroidales bacterium]